MKYKIITFTTLILIGSLVYSYYRYRHQYQNIYCKCGILESYPPQCVKCPSTTQQVSVPSRIYRDEIYSLTIPETWTMLPYNGVGLAAESNAEPRAKLELIRSMPLDFAQSFECAEKTTERNIQLDGKTVTQAFFTGIYQDGGQCGDNTATRIIVVKLNNIPDQCDYIVMHYGKSNTVIVERDMSQILSTLHFLD